MLLPGGCLVCLSCLSVWIDVFSGPIQPSGQLAALPRKVHLSVIHRSYNQQTRNQGKSECALSFSFIFFFSFSVSVSALHCAAAQHHIRVQL